MLFTKGNLAIVHISFYSYPEHKNSCDNIKWVGSVNKTASIS